MPDTPSKLTRYSACEDWSGPCNPVVNVTGDWVPYSEAAALEQRCRELEAQNERLRDAAFTEPELRMLTEALAWLNRQYVLRGGNRDFYYEEKIEAIEAKLRAALSQKGET